MHSKGWKSFVIAFVLLIFIFLSNQLFAQQKPSYSFISFDKDYTSLLSTARSQEYQISEEELNSSYGKHFLQAEKMLNFYTESLYMFFDENRKLIFFSVKFLLKENQSRTVLDKLVNSIQEKLVEKYGPNENEFLPYFKIVENQYEVVLKPRQSTSGVAHIAMKELEKYSDYQIYYEQEVEKLANDEISKTVSNF
jgi:hypothetical protein